MNHQMNKLEKAMESIRKSKKIIRILTIIIRCAAVLCLIFGLLVTVNQEQVNAELRAAAAAGEMEMVAEIKVELMGGLIQGDADLQMLEDQGEYALIIQIVMGITAVALLIMSLILGQIVSAFHEIEKSENPFTEGVLKCFKRSFILVVVLSAMSGELWMVLVMALMLSCIYRVMDYGTALQNEVDEIL